MDNNNPKDLKKEIIKLNAQLKHERSKFINQIKDIEFFYDNLLALLPGHIYWLNKDNVFLGCNDLQAKDAELKSRKDIVGKTNFDMPWKNEANDLNEFNNLVMKTGLSQIKEEYAKDKTGNIRVWLSEKVPLRDKKNKIIGILGISFDITERKQMEINLKQAQQQVEAASKAKSEFIANMSHDLRTPLTGIVGMAKDLLITAQQTKAELSSQTTLSSSTHKLRYAMQTLLDTVQEDSEIVVHSANELVQLCNEILNTVSLESGKVRTISESFNLRELITHIITLLLPTAKHKKIDLIYKIDEQIPTYLYGIHSHLNRSLLNILSNALKFTEQGFVKLHVKLAKEIPHPFHAGDKIDLLIRVEDSGIGIPPEKENTIFELFSRLNPSYEGVYKGMGLGLHAVKQYVVAMNGNIQVKSKVGKGSIFTLILPFTVSNHTDQMQSFGIDSKKQEDIPIPLPLKIKRERHKKEASILIVEDNHIAAKVLQNNLKKRYGIQSDVVNDGLQALKMIKKHWYQLVIMDIGLPRMTGIELVQTIRRLNIPQAEVPIIAVTGHAGDLKKRQHALEAGMQAVLEKPPADNELETQLKEYVLTQKKPNLFSSFKMDPSIIDWDKTLALYNNDKDFVEKLLGQIALDLTQTKKKLKIAYENSDINTLRFELHRLKGIIAYSKLPNLEKAVVHYHDELHNNKSEQTNSFHALIKSINAYLRTWKKSQSGFIH